MTRLSFSKASLQKQSALLKRYRKYLPSLDLKRQQLLAEKVKAVNAMRSTQALIEQGEKFIADQLPMMAALNIKLEHLVSVDKVEVVHENIVGVCLPMLKEVRLVEQPYSYFCKPHWVDLYVLKIKQMLELTLSLQIQQQRVELLEQAVKKVTQRVNLFDKVLIPKAQNNIRSIKIFLSDTERVAVVRAKITKQKRLRDGYR